MKKVLVIEDNLEMAENIAAILGLAHYHVDVAPNGKVGVELAQKNLPDVILCDIMMPELDGYGVLHILSKDPVTNSIPFIFLTAKADKADFRTGMNLGADDYLTKPFDGSDLLRVVEMRMKKNEQLKETFSNEPSDVDSFFAKAREMKELKNLSENRTTRSIRKKDFLYMEGQSANDMYFISKGEIKTYKTNREGKELITGIHKEGDFIGYMPLMDSESVYAESAVALTDTQVMTIPRHDFLTLIYSSRDVSMKFIKMISNNLKEAENQLLNLAYQSVRQRVAGGLLKLASIHTHICPDGASTINVPRKDISSMVGTATETLNRMLADFKDEGLIELSGEGIKVINNQKLERIAR
jgi:CRP-like cAMP-binding protein/CheY-like chemotaxis protein